MDSTVSFSGTDKKNPSLKKYFKYMVNSRKLTIKFTPGKIKQIIIGDLQIHFSKFSDILKGVSIEMFTFYIQTWPGWQPDKFQECIDSPEVSYNKFKQYLKEKILQLHEKQHLLDISEDDTISNDEESSVLNPPADCYQHLPTEGSKRKIKFPYTLEITGNPSLFNSLNFESIERGTLLNIKKPVFQSRILSTVEALNHPYVSVMFKVPGLIKFSRKNVHRIEMFLCRSTDTWTFPSQDRIVDIRKYPSRSRVYTTGFLTMLFNNLVTMMDKHIQKLSTALKQDISFICYEFLKDVIESDLNNLTIQECTEICLSIGGSSYYCDTKQKNGLVNLRKVYQPQILYSLVYCGIEKSDIDSEGKLHYFTKLEGDQELTEEQAAFLTQLRQSINLSCTMCNTHYTDMWDLKQHLMDTHYYSDTVICTKCRQEGHLHQIIEMRWAHECRNNVKITTTEDAAKS